MILNKLDFEKISAFPEHYIVRRDGVRVASAIYEGGLFSVKCPTMSGVEVLALCPNLGSSFATVEDRVRCLELAEKAILDYLDSEAGKAQEGKTDA